MKVFPIHIAKARLSKLIQRALAGEVIILARGKEPMVKLVPVEQPKGRSFGSMQGLASVGDEFFAPLPQEELDSWQQ